MWKPGTLLLARNKKATNILDRAWTGNIPDYDAELRKRYALVISVQQTGYGTKGYKWDALVLSDGMIITMIACQIIEDRFVIYEAPKGTK